MNQETLQNLALCQAIHSQEAQLCQTSDFQLEPFQAASASSLLSSLSLPLTSNLHSLEVNSSLQDPLVPASSERNAQVFLLFNERSINKDINILQDVFHAVISLNLFKCVP